MVTVKSAKYYAVGILLLSVGLVLTKENADKEIFQKQGTVLQSIPIKTVKVEKTVSSTTPVLPKMTPVSDVLDHTMYIGTAQNPTIDGGIINAADGIPVSRSVPILSAAPKIQAASLSTSSNSFSDHWATSQKVKELLEAAAQNGKLGYVLKKTNDMGLPASIATVPMVESQYQNNVVSPKGAAGAWQLMPSVAKDYGINDNQRFQFETSTNTALSLLRNLHKQFGNWDLAFAAYNAGAQRVQEALEKNPQATSVNQLDLPQETKDYVNRIMNINKILGNEPTEMMG